MTTKLGLIKAEYLTLYYRLVINFFKKNHAFMLSTKCTKEIFLFSAILLQKNTDLCNFVQHTVDK